MTDIDRSVEALRQAMQEALLETAEGGTLSELRDLVVEVIGAAGDLHVELMDCDDLQVGRYAGWATAGQATLPEAGR